MNNINEQIAQIVKDAGFQGGLFSQHVHGTTSWDAHQSGRPAAGYKSHRSGQAETPEAAIAACMAAQWILEKEDAK